MNLSAKSKATNPRDAKKPTVREKGSLPSQPSRPTAREVESSSEYTYVSVSSDSDDTDQPQRPQKHSIPPSVKVDTTMLQARVLTTMACDETISLQDFDNYIKRTGLSFFNPKNCTDEKPYKCICIFGPPNIGKSEAAASLNSYMNGVRQSTTSTKFYKWTCEGNSTNFFHYTNDSFISDTEVNWSKLLQSFHSVVFNTPGRHMIAL